MAGRTIRRTPQRGTPHRFRSALAALLAAGACSGSDDGSRPSSTAPSDPAQTPSRLEFVPELYLDPEARPDEGPPPLRVRFRPNVEDQTGEVTCEWDFGDGSAKVKEKTPTHVYETAGDYEVVVTCRDEIGTPGEEEVDVFVEEVEEPPGAVSRTP